MCFTTIGLFPCSWSLCFHAVCHLCLFSFTPHNGCTRSIVYLFKGKLEANKLTGEIIWFGFGFFPNWKGDNPFDKILVICQGILLEGVSLRVWWFVLAPQLMGTREDGTACYLVVGWGHWLFLENVSHLQKWPCGFWVGAFSCCYLTLQSSSALSAKVTRMFQTGCFISLGLEWGWYRAKPLAGGHSCKKERNLGCFRLLELDGSLLSSVNSLCWGIPRMKRKTGYRFSLYF